MATYNTTAVNHNIYPIGTQGLPLMVPRQEARTYANGDIIKGPKIERDLKIVEAIVGNDELDSDGSPTATGKLRLTGPDGSGGTDTVDVVAVAAATLGVDDGITRLNQFAALGFVIPRAGWSFEFVFDAAFATAASGQICFGLWVCPLMFGGEGPLTPSGS